MQAPGDDACAVAVVAAVRRQLMTCCEHSLRHPKSNCVSEPKREERHRLRHLHETERSPEPFSHRGTRV